MQAHFVNRDTKNSLVLGSGISRDDFVSVLPEVVFNEEYFKDLKLFFRKKKGNQCLGVS